MSKKNSHGKLRVAPPPQPANIAAQLIITAFTDGRPVDVQCTGGPIDSLFLMARALRFAAQTLSQQNAPPGEQAKEKAWRNKEIKYLGPRETISCGVDEGKKKP